MGEPARARHARRKVMDERMRRIPPATLHAYAQASGWEKHGPQDGPRIEYRHLAKGCTVRIPTDDNAADYERVQHIVADAFAMVHGRSTTAIIGELVEYGQDRIEFRIEPGADTAGQAHEQIALILSEAGEPDPVVLTGLDTCQSPGRTIVAVTRSTVDALKAGYDRGPIGAAVRRAAEHLGTIRIRTARREHGLGRELVAEARGTICATEPTRMVHLVLGPEDSNRLDTLQAQLEAHLPGTTPRTASRTLTACLRYCEERIAHDESVRAGLARHMHNRDDR